MERIDLLLAALNLISVAGQDNLARLLGCIRELEKWKEDAAHDRDHQQG